eukprot:539998-Pleurochrysis_carterae.AAC.4
MGARVRLRQCQTRALPVAVVRPGSRSQIGNVGIIGFSGAYSISEQARCLGLTALSALKLKSQ